MELDFKTWFQHLTLDKRQSFMRQIEEIIPQESPQFDEFMRKLSGTPFVNLEMLKKIMAGKKKCREKSICKIANESNVKTSISTDVKSDNHNTGKRLSRTQAAKRKSSTFEEPTHKTKKAASTPNRKEEDKRKLEGYSPSIFSESTIEAPIFSRAEVKSNSVNNKKENLLDNYVCIRKYLSNASADVSPKTSRVDSSKRPNVKRNIMNVSKNSVTTRSAKAKCIEKKELRRNLKNQTSKIKSSSIIGVTPTTEGSEGDKENRISNSPLRIKKLQKRFKELFDDEEICAKYVDISPKRRFQSTNSSNKMSDSNRKRMRMKEISDDCAPEKTKHVFDKNRSNCVPQNKEEKQIKTVEEQNGVKTSPSSVDSVIKSPFKVSLNIESLDFDKIKSIGLDHMLHAERSPKDVGKTKILTKKSHKAEVNLDSTNKTFTNEINSSEHVVPLAKAISKIDERQNGTIVEKADILTPKTISTPDAAVIKTKPLEISSTVETKSDAVFKIAPPVNSEPVETDPVELILRNIMVTPKKPKYFLDKELEIKVEIISAPSSPEPAYELETSVGIDSTPMLSSPTVELFSNKNMFDNPNQHHTPVNNRIDDHTAGINIMESPSKPSNVEETPILKPIQVDIVTGEKSPNKATFNTVIMKTSDAANASPKNSTLVQVRAISNLSTDAEIQVTSDLCSSGLSNQRVSSTNECRIPMKRKVDGTFILNSSHANDNTNNLELLNNMIPERTSDSNALSNVSNPKMSQAYTNGVSSRKSHSNIAFQSKSIGHELQTSRLDGDKRMGLKSPSVLNKVKSSNSNEPGNSAKFVVDDNIIDVDMIKSSPGSISLNTTPTSSSINNHNFISKPAQNEVMNNSRPYDKSICETIPRQMPNFRDIASKKVESVGVSADKSNTKGEIEVISIFNPTKTLNEETPYGPSQSVTPVKQAVINRNVSTHNAELACRSIPNVISMKPTHQASENLNTIGLLNKGISHSISKRTSDDIKSLSKKSKDNLPESSVSSGILQATNVFVDKLNENHVEPSVSRSSVTNVPERRESVVITRNTDNITRKIETQDGDNNINNDLRNHSQVPCEQPQCTKSAEQNRALNLTNKPVCNYIISRHPDDEYYTVNVVENCTNNVDNNNIKSASDLNGCNGATNSSSVTQQIPNSQHIRDDLSEFYGKRRTMQHPSLQSQVIGLHHVKVNQISNDDLPVQSHQSPSTANSVTTYNLNYTNTEMTQISEDCQDCPEAVSFPKVDEKQTSKQPTIRVRSYESLTSSINPLSDNAIPEPEAKPAIENINGPFYSSTLFVCLAIDVCNELLGHYMNKCNVNGQQKSSGTLELHYRICLMDYAALRICRIKRICRALNCLSSTYSITPQDILSNKTFIDHISKSVLAMWNKDTKIPVQADFEGLFKILKGFYQKQAENPKKVLPNDKATEQESAEPIVWKTPTQQTKSVVSVYTQTEVAQMRYGYVSRGIPATLIPKNLQSNQAQLETPSNDNTKVHEKSSNLLHNILKKTSVSGTYIPARNLQVKQNLPVQELSTSLPKSSSAMIELQQFANAKSAHGQIPNTSYMNMRLQNSGHDIFNNTQQLPVCGEIGANNKQKPNSNKHASKRQLTTQNSKTTNAPVSTATYNTLPVTYHQENNFTPNAVYQADKTRKSRNQMAPTSTSSRALPPQYPQGSNLFIPNAVHNVDNTMSVNQMSTAPISALPYQYFQYNNQFIQNTIHHINDSRNQTVPASTCLNTFPQQYQYQQNNGQNNVPNTVQQANNTRNSRNRMVPTSNIPFGPSSFVQNNQSNNLFVHNKNQHADNTATYSTPKNQTMPIWTASNPTPFLQYSQNNNQCTQNRIQQVDNTRNSRLPTMPNAIVPTNSSPLMQYSQDTLKKKQYAAQSQKDINKQKSNNLVPNITNNNAYVPMQQLAAQNSKNAMVPASTFFNAPYVLQQPQSNHFTPNAVQNADNIKAPSHLRSVSIPQEKSPTCAQTVPNYNNQRMQNAQIQPAPSTQLENQYVAFIQNHNINLANMQSPFYANDQYSNQAALSNVFQSSQENTANNIVLSGSMLMPVGLNNYNPENNYNVYQSSLSLPQYQVGAQENAANALNSYQPGSGEELSANIRRVSTELNNIMYNTDGKKAENSSNLTMTRQTNNSSEILVPRYNNTFGSINMNDSSASHHQVARSEQKRVSSDNTASNCNSLKENPITQLDRAYFDSYNNSLNNQNLQQTAGISNDNNLLYNGAHIDSQNAKTVWQSTVLQKTTEQNKNDHNKGESNVLQSGVESYNPTLSFISQVMTESHEDSANLEASTSRTTQEQTSVGQNGSENPSTHERINGKNDTNQTGQNVGVLGKLSQQNKSSNDSNSSSEAYNEKNNAHDESPRSAITIQKISSPKRGSIERGENSDPALQNNKELNVASNLLEVSTNKKENPDRLEQIIGKLNKTLQRNSASPITEINNRENVQSSSTHNEIRQHGSIAQKTNVQEREVEQDDNSNEDKSKVLQNNGQVNGGMRTDVMTVLYEDEKPKITINRHALSADVMTVIYEGADVITDISAEEENNVGEQRESKYNVTTSSRSEDPETRRTSSVQANVDPSNVLQSTVKLEHAITADSEITHNIVPVKSESLYDYSDEIIEIPDSPGSQSLEDPYSLSEEIATRSDNKMNSAPETSSSPNSLSEDGRIVCCTVCDAVAKIWCGLCRSACYCSVSCQKKHWLAAHKEMCPKLIELRNKNK